jgi:hypothetical protein
MAAVVTGVAKRGAIGIETSCASADGVMRVGGRRRIADAAGHLAARLRLGSELHRSPLLEPQRIPWLHPGAPSEGLAALQ